MNTKVQSDFFGLVAQHMDLDISSVRLESSFEDDFGADEISITELFYFACENFYMEKPSWLTSTLIEWNSTPEGAQIRTVGDMLSYIQKNKNTEI